MCASSKQGLQLVVQTDPIACQLVLSAPLSATNAARHRAQSSKSIPELETIREPIAFVFGDAHVAQTYVLRRNEKLYEGRVSYYSGIDGLDWTLGDALNPPP